MAKIFQTVRRIDSGGGGPVDVRAVSTTAEKTDPAMTLGLSSPAPPAPVTSPPNLRLALPISLAEESVLTAPSMSPVIASSAHTRADMVGANDIIMGPVRDSWVDEQNPNDNHINDTLLSLSSGIIGVQDQHRALVLFSLRRMDEFNDNPAPASTIALDIYFETPLLNTLFQMSFDGLLQGAIPWQNNVTWNNRPAHPITEMATLQFPPLSANGRYSVDLDLSADGTSRTTNDVIGSWFSIEIRMSGLLEVGVFGARAHDHSSGEIERLGPATGQWSLL